MKAPVATFVAALVALFAACFACAAGKSPPVRMSIDEDPITIRLATSLGHFAAEGIEIVHVDLEKLAGADYLMQEPLMKGQIDASYHWLNHAIYGARHGFPIKAVMGIHDAPGLTVMVGEPVQEQVRSGAHLQERHDA